jgi:hypothetical protein
MKSAGIEPRESSDDRRLFDIKYSVVSKAYFRGKEIEDGARLVNVELIETPCTLVNADDPEWKRGSWCRILIGATFTAQLRQNGDGVTKWVNLVLAPSMIHRVEVPGVPEDWSLHSVDDISLEHHASAFYWPAY